MHALRDITHGSQITVSYLADVGTDTQGRRRQLQADFGFRCACTTCGLSGIDLALSDQRRSRIGQLSALIQVAVNGEMRLGMPQNHTRKPTDAVHLVEERLQLMDDEGVGGTAWDTLYAGCAYSRSIGDKFAATRYASRAAESARLALGRDSAEFQKYASFIGSRAKPGAK